MPGFFKPKALRPRIALPASLTNFDYNNHQHLHVISQRLMRFKQAQTILHTLDHNIIKGFIIGSAAWVGCYVLPLVTVSITAFCLATHYASYRPQYFTQYQETLNDLIEAYKWCMGEQNDDHWHTIGLKQVQEMIVALGPYVTSKTICLWNIEDLQPATGLFPFKFKREIEPSTAFKAQLTQLASDDKTQSWQFTLYGEHSPDDLLEMLRKNLRTWVYNTIYNTPPQLRTN